MVSLFFFCILMWTLAGVSGAKSATIPYSELPTAIVRIPWLNAGDCVGDTSGVVDMGPNPANWVKVPPGEDWGQNSPEPPGYRE